jgi:hypothetical protein
LLLFSQFSRTPMCKVSSFGWWCCFIYDVVPSWLAVAFISFLTLNMFPPI